MAEAARARGLHYLAITDHSQRLTVAHGLDAERLARQIDRIDRLNATLHGITLLKGAEVDILEDGRLDLPDAVLQRLDLDDTACRMARDEGVLVVIDSDAHSGLEFDNLRFGIGQARRGWLQAADVLNTRALDELRPLLARTMRG